MNRRNARWPASPASANVCAASIRTAYAPLVPIRCALPRTANNSCAARVLRWASRSKSSPAAKKSRLIYLGVSHSLPPSHDKRLVIDIGGGSTECIIGTGYKPLKLESLFMGCVSYSLRYFRDGRVTKSSLKEADLAARAELEPIVSSYIRGNWQQAVGSSGTIRSLAEILQLCGHSDGQITLAGLDKLRSHLLRAGDMSAIELPGLRADRQPVLIGGLAILYAVLDELNIDEMTPATGAMRQGILYDMLGRFHNHDMRDVTVEQFMQRYHVDAHQARRVAAFAATLYEKLAGNTITEEAPRMLGWAARLHEIGIPVAYSGYHKHSAYIVSNADMPGFSRDEQERLASLVLSHRRSLKKSWEILPEQERAMVLALRLAAVLCRARRDTRFPPLEVKIQRDKLRLVFDAAWLEFQSTDGDGAARGGGQAGRARSQAGRVTKSAGRAGNAVSGVVA